MQAFVLVLFSSLLLAVQAKFFLVETKDKVYAPRSGYAGSDKGADYADSVNEEDESDLDADYADHDKEENQCKSGADYTDSAADEKGAKHETTLIEEIKVAIDGAKKMAEPVKKALKSTRKHYGKNSRRFCLFKKFAAPSKKVVALLESLRGKTNSSDPGVIPEVVKGAKNLVAPLKKVLTHLGALVGKDDIIEASEKAAAAVSSSDYADDGIVEVSVDWAKQFVVPLKKVIGFLEKVGTKGSNGTVATTNSNSTDGDLVEEAQGAAKQLTEQLHNLQSLFKTFKGQLKKHSEQLTGSTKSDHKTEYGKVFGKGKRRWSGKKRAPLGEVGKIVISPPPSAQKDEIDDEGPDDDSIGLNYII